MTEINHVELKHAHIFCGLGGGAAGFNRGHARVGNMLAHYRCLGGIDVDPAAIRDFDRLAGVPGTCMDLMDRSQYLDFHGKEPPADWREATTTDIHKAFNHEKPDVVFLSAPCKGFSGLLSETKSRTKKYQALNRLTLRGMWLVLEAYQDDPVDLIVFENVPRIASRGRHLLDQIVGMLEHYGYAVAETTHDCGELGGLAQSRKRFLLVARHQKVPPFLYVPKKKSLASVGTILDRMPAPGDIQAGGPLHRLPALQWKTWVRLGFVEAGSDWRSLNRLAVEDGMLRDYLLIPENRRPDYLGVIKWESNARCISGKGSPTNGPYAVSDPRSDKQMHNGTLGVNAWSDNTGVLTGNARANTGNFSVADPRFQQSDNWKDGQAYGVLDWKENTGAIAGKNMPGQGRYCVADPRPPAKPLFSKYFITQRDHNTGCVISGNDSGAYEVADPRALNRTKGDSYLTGGHYGVVPYDDSSHTVSSSASYDNGNWSVADPRIPEPDEKTTAIIIALDSTWHRPFTTLELAAIQSLVEPESYLELDGLSDSAWRERIGNAVPPAAAEAIASTMAHTILLARSGQTFVLSNAPIWVQPMLIGMSLARVNGAIC